MWMGKLWVETEQNHISPFGAPLGLALEILTRRHSATNLLGVQRKSNHAMGKLLLRRKWKVCSQLPGMAAGENEGQVVKPAPAVKSQSS